MHPIVSLLGFLPYSKYLSWSPLLHGVLPLGHFRGKESYDALRDPKSCQPGLGQVARARQCCIYQVWETHLPIAKQ